MIWSCCAILQCIVQLTGLSHTQTSGFLPINFSPVEDAIFILSSKTHQKKHIEELLELVDNENFYRNCLSWAHWTWKEAGFDAKISKGQEVLPNDPGVGFRFLPPPPLPHFTDKTNILTPVPVWSEVWSALLWSAALFKCEQFQRIFFLKGHKTHPVLIIFLNILGPSKLFGQQEPTVVTQISMYHWTKYTTPLVVLLLQ